MAPAMADTSSEKQPKGGFGGLGDSSGYAPGSPTTRVADGVMGALALAHGSLRSRPSEGSPVAGYRRCCLVALRLDKVE